MKEKLNQMFKEKLFLVMLVLGLLTIVAAAGVVRMQNGSGQEQNPYVDMQNQQEFLAENTDTETQVMVAGESNANPVKPQTKETETEHTYQVAAFETAEASNEEAAPAGSGLNAATALVLNFSDSSSLSWPVRGNVILDYNMESTIYFPTLDQYKCNSALVIQGEVSDPVYAPANAKVLEVGFNEEIGNYLKLDLGNEYGAICGQLKEVSVVAGEYLEQGQLMGYIAEPTKYYSVEGSNIFLELTHQEKPVDPLDYLE